MLFSSKLSPIPTLNVPEITLTFSRLGCQWGAMRYPLGIFRHNLFFRSIRRCK
jgi:hypothetical protein